MRFRLSTVFVLLFLGSVMLSLNSYPRQRTLTFDRNMNPDPVGRTPLMVEQFGWPLTFWTRSGTQAVGAPRLGATISFSWFHANVNAMLVCFLTGVGYVCSEFIRWRSSHATSRTRLSGSVLTMGAMYAMLIGGTYVWRSYASSQYLARTAEQRNCVNRLRAVQEALSDVNIAGHWRSLYSSEVELNVSFDGIDSILERWEPVANAYSHFCSSRDLVTEEREEAFFVLVQRTVLSEEQLFNQWKPRLISMEDAMELNDEYETERLRIYVRQSYE